jgi:hypothetical protein
MGFMNAIRSLGIILVEAESNNYKKLKAVDDSTYYFGIKKVEPSGMVLT